MLDRQKIRANPDAIKAGARRKGIGAPIDDFLETEMNWRAAATKVESVEAEANRVSKSIGAAIAQGQIEEAEAAKRRASELKTELPALHEAARNLKDRLEALELQIPNMPHQSVPDGKDSSENVEVSRYRDKPTFDFEPKAHWDIADQHGLLDFERGTKIAGSGFIVFRGAGARLQRALINFMLDFHVRQHGYTEIYPPYLVNRESLIGTGQLPKFEMEQYHMERDDLFLIATSEIPVTNLHRDEILNADALPIKYVAFSGCFRREAGAAGKDTRGLLRVHQFDKVEMVKFTTPEASYDELETLRQDAEDILRALGLHYRVVSICAGDMSFSNAKQYDLEVWAPGVGQYLEVSSISNFEDFQARRAHIRYRPDMGAKPKFVHTLNASGVACPRLMAALLETYQRADGSVDIPDALRPFMGVEKIG